MGIILTPSQQSCLNLRENLSVTANPGAGKTYVLARRFVEILLKTDAKISETVAITFTEQAAGQLKKKIRDEVIAMERDPATAPALKKKLRQIRVNLASAQIGTIHSLCARILRLYPVEAGVDASFSVLEGQERERLTRESITEALGGLLDERSDTQRHRNLRSLLGMLRPVKLERHLLQLFRQREQIHRMTGGGTPAEIQPGGGAVEATLRGISASIVSRAESRDWHANAELVAKAARGKPAAVALRLLAGWRDEADRPARAKIIHDVGKIAFTQKGGYQKKFLGKDMDEEALPTASAAFRDFHDTHGSLLRSLFEGDPAETQERFHRHLSALIMVYGEALKLYEARKDDLGVLDFEDLQIRALRLLADDAVRDRVAALCRYILVDEFQDTNDLQYSIVKRLMTDFRRGNSFIVGDPKQSIYGFRNAEVEVFAEARREISGTAAGGDAGKLPGGPIVLRESFRPLPFIAGFVNTVFSSLLGDAGSPPGIPHEDLMVTRVDAGPGSVEMLIVSDRVDGAPADPVALECSMVAARIRTLVDGAPSEPDARAIGFGDCAVLMRDRKNLMDLERAFENAGIPYVLAGGVGYFQTQEVFDFLNYLSFLVDQGDDVALAGLLRSPFFGLADDELFLLSMEQGDTLWEKLGMFCEANPVHTRARAARSLLLQHAALRDRIPVSRLLRSVARETGWVGTVAGLAHGPQHRENFLKLLDLARVNESKGVSSLYDFVDFLGHHADREEREGQASTAMAERAVKIMTIHAAKGLEFRAVFLPFTDRKIRPDADLLVDPRHGISFRTASPGDEKKTDPPSMRYLKLLSTEKRLAEEKRVFYVACTRAEDHLVISGRENEGSSLNSPAGSPLGWLTDIFGGQPLGGKRGLIGPVKVKLRTLRRDGGQLKSADRVVALTIPVIRNDGSRPSAPRVVAQGREVRRRRILTGPLTDEWGGDTYSATQIRTYLHCPALYYFRYVLGLRPSPSATAGALQADRSDDRADAGIEGDLTHAMLSGIFANDVAPESIRGRISAMMRYPGEGEDPGSLASRVFANVTSFTGSEEGRAILNSSEAKTEFPISTILERSVVSGIVDRLYRGEGGLWEIVDYKTDEIPVSGIASKALIYKPQVAVYALMVHRVFRQSPVRAKVLFLKERCQAVDFIFGDEELSAVREQILDVIGRIRKGLFPGRDLPCEGCPDSRRVVCGKGAGKPAP